MIKIIKKYISNLLKTDTYVPDTECRFIKTLSDKLIELGIKNEYLKCKHNCFYDKLHVFSNFASFVIEYEREYGNTLRLTYESNLLCYGGKPMPLYFILRFEISYLEILLTDKKLLSIVDEIKPLIWKLIYRAKHC